MRIINTDNFGGDYPNEKFIAIDIPDKEQAEAMAKGWNERFSGDHASRFARVVPDDYKLAPGFEP